MGEMHRIGWLRDQLPGLDSSARQKLDYLAAETDPTLHWNGLLNLAQQAEFQDQLNLAIPIYEFLIQDKEASIPASVSRQARKQLDAILGRGAPGDRLEFLGRGFAKAATDPALIFAFGSAGLAYKFIRFKTLGGLFQLPASGLTRGWAASTIASLTGFAGESLWFPVAAKLGNQALGRPVEWSWQNFKHEAASSVLILGGLKVMGGLSRLGVQQLSTPGIVASQLVKVPQAALPQAGMLTGIMLGHKAEEWTGLRQPVDGATTLTDSLMTLFQLNTAGSLLRATFPRIQRWEQRFETKYRYQKIQNSTSHRKNHYPIIQGLTPALATAGKPRNPYPNVKPEALQMSANDGFFSNAWRTLSMLNPTRRRLKAIIEEYNPNLIPVPQEALDLLVKTNREFGNIREIENFAVQYQGPRELFAKAIEERLDFLRMAAKGKTKHDAILAQLPDAKYREDWRFYQNRGWAIDFKNQKGTENDKVESKLPAWLQGDTKIIEIPLTVNTEHPRLTLTHLVESLRWNELAEEYKPELEAELKTHLFPIWKEYQNRVAPEDIKSLAEGQVWYGKPGEFNFEEYLANVYSQAGILSHDLFYDIVDFLIARDSALNVLFRYREQIYSHPEMKMAVWERLAENRHGAKIKFSKMYRDILKPQYSFRGTNHPVKRNLILEALEDVDFSELLKLAARQREAQNKEKDFLSIAQTGPVTIPTWSKVETLKGWLPQPLREKFYPFQVVRDPRHRRQGPLDGLKVGDIADLGGFIIEEGISENPVVASRMAQDQVMGLNHDPNFHLMIREAIRIIGLWNQQHQDHVGINEIYHHIRNRRVNWGSDAAEDIKVILETLEHAPSVNKNIELLQNLTRSAWFNQLRHSERAYWYLLDYLKRTHENESALPPNSKILEEFFLPFPQYWKTVAMVAKRGSGNPNTEKRFLRSAYWVTKGAVEYFEIIRDFEMADDFRELEQSFREELSRPWHWKK